MIKSPFIFVLAISAGILVGSGMPATAGLRSLRGHVPTVTSHLVAKGRLSAETNLSLAIGLPLRNQDTLTNLLREIYDPASPNYHQYLTPEQFTAQFGPTEEDYQKVIDFAQTNGLAVVGRHSNRMLVDVKGKSSAVEKTFNVKMHVYKHPTEARDFFAPDAEPSVNADVPVLHVSGLENYALPHPALHRMPAAYAKPTLGSGPFGAFLGSDFRNAYVPGTALNGSGQMVGLLQFESGFFQSDITAYAALAGLPNVPVQTVLLNGYGGGPGSANDEVSLDIEMVMSMAPGVSKILVFEGSFTDDILNAMASSNQVKQLSASWSYPIDSTTEQIFKQFAAQGQSFFNASGDSDAWVGPIPSPRDDPYITIVGGTTLTTATNKAWSAETVWNWGFGTGGGGGISTVYPIPSWQSTVNMTANHGSTTKRNIPDVALTADNVYVLYGGGQSGAFGGTSCASPLWAAFCALVNQQAAAGGALSMGFLNPALYTIGQGANYASCFHDIKTGDNTWFGSPNLFYATNGYDLCTGWGTPNGVNLINALVGGGPTHLSAPLAPYGATLSVLNGGNPNGSWSLFVADDSPFDAGVISNGWSLTLTTATPVGLAADLALSMSASASSVVVGNNFVYTIGVTNYGPSTSTNAVILDTLPANVTVVATNVTQGTINLTASELRWNVGPFTTNAGARLTLTVQAASAGSIINSATVNSTVSDPNPDDDFASVTVNATGSATPPALSAVLVGGSGAFQLSVTNATGSVIIQASTNLLTWVPVYTNTPPFTFSDANKTNYSRRFYRAVLGP